MGFKQGGNMISSVLQEDYPVSCMDKKMGVREIRGAGLEAQSSICSFNLHKDPQ